MTPQMPQNGRRFPLLAGTSRNVRDLREGDRGVAQKVCDLRDPALRGPQPMWFIRRQMAPTRAAAKPSCEQCFFRCNLLCALERDEACTTFRPDHPEGLRPPRQLRFHFRTDRPTRAAWAFPTAAEQAERHAVPA
jgi:hypothetical protein